MSEHSEILPLLAAHHDGALTADARARVLRHLEECTDCRQRLADWQALDVALRELPDDAPAGRDLRLGSLTAIVRPGDAESERTEGWGPGRRTLVWSAAAAAVVVIALTGSLILDSKDESPQMASTPAPATTPSGNTTLEPGSNIPDALRDRAERQEEAQREAAGTPRVARPPDEPADPLTADRSGTPSGQATLGDERDAAQSAQLANREATAPVSVGDGDSGIPHHDDWPARLYDSIVIPIHYRLPVAFAADVVEMNLVPEFEVEFVGVGYAIGDLLAPDHEIRLDQPIELSDEASYLVSNLRTERAVLMSRVGQQVVSAEVSLRLAEITWRLANITADPDDVYSAIAAQTLAMRQKPELATQSRARVAHLQGLLR